jgi:hypothetical protein
LVEGAGDPLVVMEIKTEALIPRWLIDVVQQSELRRKQRVEILARRLPDLSFPLSFTATAACPRAAELADTQILDMTRDWLAAEACVRPLTALIRAFVFGQVLGGPTSSHSVACRILGASVTRSF